ncbi:MAG: hypothetical protein RL514_1226 [Verrucomicrobiota bacterium]|jgi:hypothetical protein
MRSQFLAALTVFATSTSLCLAEQAADLKPLLNQPGKLVVDEKFAGGALPSSWGGVQGDWQVRDGAVVGKEKASDEHPAVLFLNQPHRDAIVRFSFKLDGAKSFNLSLNHPKGHLFRVTVAEDGLSLSKDKDKKDPKSKVVQLGKASGKFEAGKWHTLLLETKGGKVSVQADNGAKVEGSHPELEVDKTGYRFVMRGESLRLSDVKVWQAEQTTAAK